MKKSKNTQITKIVVNYAVHN